MGNHLVMPPLKNSSMGVGSNLSVNRVSGRSKDRTADANAFRMAQSVNDRVGHTPIGKYDNYNIVQMQRRQRRAIGIPEQTVNKWKSVSNTAPGTKRGNTNLKKANIDASRNDTIEDGKQRGSETQTKREIARLAEKLEIHKITKNVAKTTKNAKNKQFRYDQGSAGDNTFCTNR